MRYLIICLFLCPLTALAQTTAEKVMGTLGPNPLFFLDSVRVSHDQLQLMDANQVTLVIVYKMDHAVQLYGDSAKDGAVWIETRPFARKHYITFFRKISPKYDSLYNIAKTDTTFQYIANDKIETGSFEGSFESIDDKTFISMDIINADDLKKKYNITDKQYGIILAYKKTGTIIKE